MIGESAAGQFAQDAPSICRSIDIERRPGGSGKRREDVGDLDRAGRSGLSSEHSVRGVRRRTSDGRLASDRRRPGPPVLQKDVAVCREFDGTA